MEIIRLRLKNITSLYGEWMIDFTDPVFEEQGIFALVGPTGSGKSSILDAICLAIYGRTPRLNSVTKSENHIMSRGAAECWAEVEFITPAGEFRVFWSQKRARMRAQGQLQQPKHELVHVDSGKILAEKISTVSKKIESITGLDFDRFCRSILLAQGEFASFLKANEDVRAPILEKITGSHIYSLISQRAYDMDKSNAHTIELLHSTQRAISLLSDEEHDSLLSEKTELYSRRETVLTHQRELLEKQTWYNQIEALRAQVGERKAALAAQQEIVESLHTEKAAIERAQEADIVFPTYEKVQRNACDLQRVETTLDSVEQRIEEETQKINRFKDQLEQSQREWENREREQKDLEQIAPRVIELDQNILLVQTQLHQSKAAIASLQVLAQTYTDTIEEKTQTLSLVEEQGKKILQEMAAYGDKDELINLHEYIKYTNEELLDIERTITRLEQEIENLDTHATDFHAEKEKLHKQYDEVREKNLGNDKHLTELENELELLLQHRTIESWRETIQKLYGLDKTVQALVFSGEKQKTLKDEEHSVQQQMEKAQLHRQHIEQQYEEISEQQRKHEQLIQSCEQQAQQIWENNHIVSLRARLEEHDQCPVCGSTHHPNSQTQTPDDDSTDVYRSLQRQIEEHTSSLHEITERLVEYKARLHNHDDHIQMLAASLDKISTEYTRLNESNLAQYQIIEQDMIQLSTVTEPSTVSLGHKTPDLLESVQKAAQRIEETLVSSRNIVSQYEMLTHQRAELKEQSGRNQQSIHTIEHSMNQLNFQSHNHTAAKDNKKRELEQLQEKQQILTSQLFEKAQKIPYCRDNIRTLSAPEMAECIRQAVHDIRKLLHEQEKNHHHLVELNFSLQSARKDKEKNQENLIAQETIFAQSIDNSEQLTRERKKLFAGTDITITQQENYQAIRSLTHTLHSIQRELAISEQNKDHLLQEKEEQSKQHEAIAIQHNDLHKELEKLLHQFSFADTTELLNARLSIEEITRFESTYHTALEKHTRLQTLHDDTVAQLHTTIGLELTDIAPEQITQQLDVNGQELSTVEQKIGEITAKLEEQEKRLKEYRLLQAEIDDVTREGKQWHILNTLIGSRDGKAYRKYAQGLTFRFLIHNANKQLAKMSDRYILVPHEDHSLELEVEDLYLAGERRSTKNLSGGESFIISLALALGLAGISHHHQPLNSLFLDEGFGTLDEDTLEQALQTLSILHTEGKKIGIISHIPVLKERLSVHIQIMPVGGGRSVIKGPGCMLLSS